jgi:hypothetical protein
MKVRVEVEVDISDGFHPHFAGALIDLGLKKVDDKDLRNWKIISASDDFTKWKDN